MNASTPARVRVWDLPTRLTHWALAVLVAAAVTTAKLGGLWLDWHMRIGYAILALVTFRLLWGFAGSRYARWTQFLRGPGTVLAYLRGRLPAAPGHNPLGGLAVVAMLAVLLVQAGSGLFTNDDIAAEGPLARLVSGATSARLSTLHRWGETAVLALVGLHLAAIAFHTVVRRDRLIGPMLTGDRADIVDAPPAADDAAMRLRAAVLAALAAAFVSYLVTL